MSTSVETVAPEVTAPPPARPTLLPLVRRLHFYAGVLVAPLLVIAAVTGLLYAFTPQWDELAYGEQLHVARVGDHPLPLTDQVRAAQSEVPGGTLHSVRPGEHPDDTTRIAFTVAGLEDQQRTVFVDPYTGQSRGVLTTTSGATPVTSWLSELHRSLHLGEPGRLYSETAASWLWVLALGGLTLWLSRRLRRPAVLTPKRGRAADATPERGRMLPGRRAVGGVRRTRGWHATTGIWLLTFLLVLSATGLTWSGYAGGRFEAALEALDARSPDVDTALPGGAGAPPPGSGTGSHHGSGSGSDSGSGSGSGSSGGGEVDATRIDAVVAAARGAGLDGPVVVTPAATGQAWVVTQDDDVWPVRYDELAVDPATGAVVAENRWQDWPVMAQLSRLGIQFHMGKLFGLANQLLLAAVAVGLLAMIFWGYRMWWQRRPTRTGGWVGRPPARGAWRSVPATWLALGAVVLGAVAWALPLLGVTLAAFLLLDVALGTLARHRAT